MNLLPRRYSDGYSQAILFLLKAWLAVWMLGEGQRENPPTPAGHVTPADGSRGSLLSERLRDR